MTNKQVTIRKADGLVFTVKLPPKSEAMEWLLNAVDVLHAEGVLGRGDSITVSQTRRAK
jgi:hypothetical protein